MPVKQPAELLSRSRMRGPVGKVPRIEYTYPYPVMRPSYAPRQGPSCYRCIAERGRWCPFRRGELGGPPAAEHGSSIPPSLLGASTGQDHQTRRD